MQCVQVLLNFFLEGTAMALYLLTGYFNYDKKLFQVVKQYKHKQVSMPWNTSILLSMLYIATKSGFPLST